MKVITLLEKFIKWICMLLIVILLSLVFFQVCSRAIFGKGYVQIEETTQVLMGWCAFCSIAYTTRKKAHVAIDFFVDKLPPSAKKIVGIFINLIIIAAASTAFVASISMVGRKALVPMMTIPIPSSYWYSSFPFGMFFVVVFLLYELYVRIKNFKEVNEEA